VCDENLKCEFLLYLQLCLALFLVSALAEEKESSTKSKAVPLEKKLDKRGLLDLGYGYGINGLDVGYIGHHGHHGGAYHHAAPVIQSSPFAHSYGNPFYLGHKTDYHKTVTITKGVPVPYEVTFSSCLAIKFPSQRKLLLHFFFVNLRSRSTFPSNTRNTSRIPSR
jgi:hypothetical protein